MRRICNVPIGLFLLSFFSCKSHNTSAETSTDSLNGLSAVDRVPMYRATINPNPVAEYKEKVKNALNDWYFSVDLYETKKTFYYLINLQFEEVRGVDTLKLPNLGAVPRPQIQKGNDKYSCILGFLDGQNKFNEYKLVSVADGNIKLTTLKHYYGAVYTK
jgi:hypothetical protein